MKDCTNCANALFDEVWGEYKCKEVCHVIYDTDGQVDCIYYKKGKPGISKDKPEER
jgi:hypothetical protein